MSNDVLDAHPFKVYITRRKAGETQVFSRQSMEHPGLLMDDDLRAEAREMLEVDPDNCMPMFGITVITTGKFLMSYSDGLGEFIMERGSTPSRLQMKADVVIRFPVDTVFCCLFPQTPDPICYRRKAVLLAAGGEILVEPKDYTRHIWLAEGSLAGHTAPMLLTINPGEEKTLQSIDGMLGYLVWHESR